MSTRKIKFSFGEYYHLYNRGVDKRVIFLDDRDRERFLTLMFLSNSNKSFQVTERRSDPWSFEEALENDRGQNIVSVGAWCLMPNHFHVLIKEESEGGISKFMLKLLTGYSAYFNKKYHRTGALFEGAFKAGYAKSDEYLKYLFSYIHLNPIGIIEKGWKEKHIEDIPEAKLFVERYDFSSYKDYTEENRAFGRILSKNTFPDYFETIAKFKKMHSFWMENNEKRFVSEE